MSMQLTLAKINDTTNSNKSLEFNIKENLTLNITDLLYKEICSYYVKADFVEVDDDGDEEKIIYDIIKLSDVRKLYDQIRKKLDCLLEKINHIRGNQEKATLTSDSKDLCLLIDMLMRLLILSLADNSNEYTLVVI